MPHQLQGVAKVVARRAQEQGFVLPREIRAELAAARLPEDLWKEVAALARPALRYRGGRYYLAEGVSPRQKEEEQRQRLVRRAVRRLVQSQRAGAPPPERRSGNRVNFIQPIKVWTEDDREYDLLSRDISAEGLRLIGTRSLLGQKVRVLVPGGPGCPPQGFLVRVLWTCTVGDGLFENGGAFLEVLPPEFPGLKIVS